MKRYLNNIALMLVILAGALSSCKKDLEQVILIAPASVAGFTSSATSMTLSDANKDDKVVAFTFDPVKFNTNVNRPSYSLQFDLPADTSGANAWGKAISVELAANEFSKSFTGFEINSILVNQLKVAPGADTKLVVRLKADVKQSSNAPSAFESIYSKVELTVKPYDGIVIYPALLVKGEGGWVTPTTRTNGFVLTSPGYDTKYEGYVYVPDPNGWGGANFRLESTINGTSYGWELNPANGALWATPSPNYLKINADLNSKVISYTPASFFVTGDHNSWNVAANPLVYDAQTHKLVAQNVVFAAGQKFQFTANGGYDLSYMVDNNGKLQFAGPPNWNQGGALTNITVAEAGTYTVTLDLSQGAGKYTYSLVKQ